MNDFESIKNKIDIVDVVGRFVSLKRAGGAFVGLCPFHQDKTPSFSVSQRLQKFRCWSCGESGDVVDFICKIENKGKKEALETLLGGRSIVDIPNTKKVAENAKKEVCFLDGCFVERSRHDKTNVLHGYLCTIFGEENTRRAFELYRVGTTKTGGAIWWQIDTQNRVRGGKIMQYMEDGHRDKEKHPKWVHTELQKNRLISSAWELSQCLFGEHLLSLNKNTIVCLVEAEKTALIGSIVAPRCVWVATGGASNLNKARLKPLKGRRVVVYPDGDAVEQWAQIVQELQADGYNIRIADNYTKIVGGKMDIADYILQVAEGNLNDGAIFYREKQNNKHFKEFCELFDIELVSQCQKRQNDT